MLHDDDDDGINNNDIIIIIIIYSLKIGAGQQGRIPGTYNCPQCKIKAET